MSPGRSLNLWVGLGVFVAAVRGGWSQEVTIPDPALEKAVRAELRKPEGALTGEDLEGLYSLTVQGGSAPIRSLEGLERARYLTSLVANDQALTSVVVPTNWTHLRKLDLRRNALTNLQWEGTPQWLETLDVRNNALPALNLPPGLLVLRLLLAASNQLTRAEMPADLSAVESWVLDDNRITEFVLPAQAIPQYLGLAGNPLTRFDWLEPPRSIRHLNLSRTRLPDFGFLGALTSLESLDLSGMTESGATHPGVLRALASLSSLKELRFRRNGWTDGRLEWLPASLESVDLTGNALTHLVLPEELLRLELLRLSGNRMRDLGFLARTVAPMEVYLDENEMEEAALPPGPASVVGLAMLRNRLSSVRIPAGYSRLKWLWVSRNQLTNLTLAPDLVSLVSVIAESNRLARLEVPSGLPQLAQVDVSWNPLEDLRLASGLPSLSSLNLQATLLRTLLIPPGVDELQFVGIYGNLITTVIAPEDSSPERRKNFLWMRQAGVAVHYYPLEARLDPPRREFGVWTVELRGPPGRYQVLASEDLRTWQPAGTVVNRTGASPVVDSGEGPPAGRFYRAYRWGPVDP